LADPERALTLTRMRIGATFIVLAAAVAPLAIAQEDVQHTGTFEEAMAHHSGADLRAWKAAHPWSLGDRLAGFFAELFATRKVGERVAIERAQLQAAFLAESLAEDPFSGWIIDVLGWDTEACARHETTLASVAALPEMIAAGEADAAWAGIADLREHVAPPGGWALCAPDLVRAAAAFLHAGDKKRAQELATEVAASSEELRQGAVLAACERILGEIARQSGDLGAAEHRIARSFEIRRELDSGSFNALPDEIERLDRCEIDTVIEFAVGEGETLAVVVGSTGRTAQMLSVGRASIDELVKRLLDPKTFDEKAARELYGKLLQPFEAQLGTRIGIVPDGALANLPFEMLITESTHASFGRDHGIVYLSHPPLGGAKSMPGPGAAQAARSFVVSEISGPERAASTEKLHAAGVQDVVENLWPVDAAKQTFLLRFHRHLDDGESVPEASRSARRELMDGNKEAGVEPVGPRIWAAWIVHRRF
jgi:hypothetical protein